MAYLICLGLGIIVGLVAALYALAERNLIRGQIRAPKRLDRPAPKPEPVPAPKPEPEPAPKPEPVPAPKPEPEPAPKPEPELSPAALPAAAPGIVRAYGGPPPPMPADFSAELKGALLSLGYKAKEANHRAKLAMAHKPSDLPTALRWALK